MTDHAALLGWLQLHDSAFPAGRFVHSNGVESWLGAHPHATPRDICAVIDAFVGHSVATLDAVVAAHAWGTSDTDGLIALDQLTSTYKIAAGARTASWSCGRRLVTAARSIGVTGDAAQEGYLLAVTGGRADGNLAVVEAVVQSALGIERFDAVLGSVRSAYAGVLSAAVRLGRLGPMQAQRMLLERRQVIAELTGAAIETPLDDIGSVTVELELHGMRHEAASGRMFAT